MDLSSLPESVEKNILANTEVTGKAMPYHSVIVESFAAEANGVS
jgi:hypothetical protein